MNWRSRRSLDEELRAQADALGVGSRFAEVLEAYHHANLLLGRPVKVTPSSKANGRRDAKPADIQLGAI